MRVSLVLWDGLIGGAERVTVSLAGEFRRRGVDASVVFVGAHDQLGDQLRLEDVPARRLGLARGALVLRHPRLLAAAVQDAGADVAILDGFGYLGLALRAGGFRGTLIGVEHGALSRVATMPAARRLIRTVDRASGVLVHDAEVAVSEFMERIARNGMHSSKLVRIPHGVPIPLPVPPPPALNGGPLAIGYVGRLFPGKGVEVLLRAVALIRSQGRHPTILTIAGDGPDRPRLEGLTAALGLRDVVTFIGWTEDLGDFWSRCHLAVAPNDGLEESFCLAIAEAMAFSRPSVVTAAGALPELVIPGVTGAIVRPGDWIALASAVSRYAEAPELLSEQGVAARARAELLYSLDRCATGYLSLAETLVQYSR